MKSKFYCLMIVSHLECTIFDYLTETKCMQDVSEYNEYQWYPQQFPIKNHSLTQIALDSLSLAISLHESRPPNFNFELSSCGHYQYFTFHFCLCKIQGSTTVVKVGARGKESDPNFLLNARYVVTVKSSTKSAISI